MIVTLKCEKLTFHFDIFLTILGYILQKWSILKKSCDDGFFPAIVEHP